MRKYLLLLLVTLITIFTFSGCEKHSDGDREEILININGEWNIRYENKLDGEIVFDNYETFMILSNQGPTLYGDMTMLPNRSNVLSIYYIENEEGEEYEYSGYCTIMPYNADSISVNNLPYYENKNVTLVRK